MSRKNDSKAQEEKKKNNSGTSSVGAQGNPKLSGPDRPST